MFSPFGPANTEKTKECLGEGVLLNVLGCFLECFPENVCILNSEGEIFRYNAPFFAAILQRGNECPADAENNASAQMINIFPFFEPPSASLLQKHIKLLQDNQAIEPDFLLKHVWNKTTIKYTLQSCANAGLPGYYLLLGYENKSLFSLMKFMDKAMHTITSNPASVTPESSLIKSFSKCSYESGRSSRPGSPTNQLLHDVTNLISYGERQAIIHHGERLKRSNQASMRVIVRERDDMCNLMDRKRTFVRSVAHEIRTPLTVVISGLDLIELELNGACNIGTLTELVSDARTACLTAVDTIGDFIAFEKFDGNIMEADKSKKIVLDAVAKSLRPFFVHARAKRIELIFEKEQVFEKTENNKSCLHLVNIDEYKMNQVIRNLVSNAIKFSPQDGKVCVKLLKKQRQDGSFFARLEVTDSGPGISEENQKKLFNQIVQFNPGELQGGGGSGLGLWIAKRIMDMHEGVIGIESKGEGFGCTFFIEIPLLADTVESEPPVAQLVSPIKRGIARVIFF